MKHSILTLFTLLLCVSTSEGQEHDGREKTFPLDRGWKFVTGDSLVFAKPEYDDSRWRPIAVDRIWEQSGYPDYNGFAWYRTSVIIPSSLKNGAQITDELFFDMGKIDDADQVFLNGVLIGEDCETVTDGRQPDLTFTDPSKRRWNVQRRYILKSDHPGIRWDAPNTIAVRVFDGGGGGGIYSGALRIKTPVLRDYILVETNKVAYRSSNDSLHKRIWITNRSSFHPIEGTVTVRMTDNISGSVIRDSVLQFRTEPGSAVAHSIGLRKPLRSTMVVIMTQLNDGSEPFTNSETVPYILTPPSGDRPVINGARVYGQRTGKPFLYRIAATGNRPMKFSADHLPQGLVLDKHTGIISGSVTKAGDYVVTLTSENERGKTKRDLKIIIGKNIALTPPMGWNSWNCWGLNVSQERVLDAARSFVSAGLADHGWSYINIDDGWEIPSRSTLPKRESNGTIITNTKFPDMKRLGDEIHALGLKYGIYSSPGSSTCGNYTASYGFEHNDAESYAKWGIDYLKYDWCSYSENAKDTSLTELKKPYAVMRTELDKLDRDIVYSLCQYGMGNVWEWGNDVGGNLWRTTGDIVDTWQSLSGIGFSQIENAPYSRPGNWNDPDMLIVGWLGWGENLHPTRLTADEQYTHISLWALLSSPMLIGCDLTRLDEFTLNLLTNDEVIAIDQDPLGYQARRVIEKDSIQVWTKKLEDGTTAFGLFNLSGRTVNYDLQFKEVGLPSTVMLRDVWRQKEIGKISKHYTSIIPSHGVILLKTKL